MARPRQGKKRRGGFMMKMIIAGSRHFDDYSKLVSVVDGVLERLGTPVKDVILVCGCCPRGADVLAVRLAGARGWSIEKYPAEWDRYGRAAGPIRNRQMAAVADVCVLFPCKGKENRGTKDMCQAARSKGVVTFAANF